MKTIIHARNEDALRNGSFVAQRITKHSSTYSQYMHGDFIGFFSNLPEHLKHARQTWTLKDARKLMPKGI